MSDTNKDLFAARNKNIRKHAIAHAGARCEFPGCAETAYESLQIAFINSVSKNGARYDPSLVKEDTYSIDNTIVLCASHHLLVDSQPEYFSASFLFEVRNRNRGLTAELQIVEPIMPVRAKIDQLQHLLKHWNDQCNNSIEKDWQFFFHNNPIALTSTVNNRFMIYIDQKCYLGGKDYTNKGGNIADFILGSRTGSASIVEIKTPVTRLIGGSYRNNSYSISEELTGAICQALSYKRAIIQESALRSYKLPVEAHEVPCVIIAGNTNELDSDVKKLTFNSFRGCLSGIFIMTYDELFAKIEDLI